MSVPVGSSTLFMKLSELPSSDEALRVALPSDWLPWSVEAAFERLVGHSVALWAVRDRHQGLWSCKNKRPYHEDLGRL